jgi:hypothetical protein
MSKKWKIETIPVQPDHSVWALSILCHAPFLYLKKGAGEWKSFGWLLALWESQPFVFENSSWFKDILINQRMHYLVKSKYSREGLLGNLLAYASSTNAIENMPCCYYKCVMQYFLNTKCGRIFLDSIKHKCGRLIYTGSGKSSKFLFKFIASNCKV